ncbi:MAG: HesA/MoeB/ThiF family protein, partial [Methanimicrococcus sp.]|nr:HesA/MoeB/ThiF family protein [Methanimicrococcus sp.]
MTFERYTRQLPLIGEEGQKKLSQASVFIAGAGGLGSPVATYLAAAGVGHITLLDSDVVDETNLNRQFLHGSKDTGRNKTTSGAEKLRALNPEIEIIEKAEKLTAENVSDLVGDCQIIADALDNNETRQ